MAPRIDFDIERGVPFKQRMIYSPYPGRVLLDESLRYIGPRYYLPGTWTARMQIRREPLALHSIATLVSGTPATGEEQAIFFRGPRNSVVELDIPASVIASWDMKRAWYDLILTPPDTLVRIQAGVDVPYIKVDVNIGGKGTLEASTGTPFSDFTSSDYFWLRNASTVESRVYRVSGTPGATLAATTPFVGLGAAQDKSLEVVKMPDPNLCWVDGTDWTGSGESTVGMAAISSSAEEYRISKVQLALGAGVTKTFSNILEGDAFEIRGMRATSGDSMTGVNPDGIHNVSFIWKYAGATETVLYLERRINSRMASNITKGSMFVAPALDPVILCKGRINLYETITRE